MKAIFKFWNKDLINKMIILVSFVLITGVLVIVYLLFTMKSDSMFYAVFSPLLDDEAVPTLAVVAPVTATPSPPLSFPTFTVPAHTATPEIAPPAAEQPTATLFSPTATPVLPTQVLVQVTPTLELSISASQVAACIPNNPPQTGKVLDVIDGNTIKVLLDGFAYTVRYIGIDVPKFRPVPEYFGQESDFKNAEYVFAEDVTLIADVQDKDEGGRLLRYVKVGETFINFELVRQGFATASSATSACSQVFKNAEQIAIQEKIGKWQPTPTIPSP